MLSRELALRNPKAIPSANDLVGFYYLRAHLLVAPSSKNHGEKPSLFLLRMMRMC
jgi:hypothetical protein